MILDRAKTKKSSEVYQLVDNLMKIIETKFDREDREIINNACILSENVH